MLVNVDYKPSRLYRHDMKSSPTVAAVISGDFVLSEELSSAVRKAVPGKLNEAVIDLRTRFNTDVSEIDLYRGDAWQLIVEDPAHAVNVALAMRLSLMTWQSAVDTRAVVGIGGIESRGETRVSSGFGEAFTRSGRALDALPRDRRMSIQIGEEDGGEILDAGVHMLDRIVGEWTTAQARAVLGAMSGMSQDEIGASWKDGPISQQAVAQHLQRASWGAVNHWLEALADYIQQSYPSS